MDPLIGAGGIIVYRKILNKSQAEIEIMYCSNFLKAINEGFVPVNLNL